MSVWDFLLVFGVGMAIGALIMFLILYAEARRIEAEQKEDPPEPFDE